MSIVAGGPSVAPDGGEAGDPSPGGASPGPSARASAVAGGLCGFEDVSIFNVAFGRGLTIEAGGLGASGGLGGACGRGPSWGGAPSWTSAVQSRTGSGTGIRTPWSRKKSAAPWNATDRTRKGANRLMGCRSGPLAPHPGRPPEGSWPARASGLQRPWPCP